MFTNEITEDSLISEVRSIPVEFRKFAYWKAAPDAIDALGKVKDSEGKLLYSAKSLPEIYEVLAGRFPALMGFPLTREENAIGLSLIADTSSFAKASESDPLGKSPNQPGAKLDAGKNRVGLVLFGFSRALQEVSKVGTYGANKYTDNGWMEVPDGERRYTDAMLRHLLKEAAGEEKDPDTELLHAAHAAWNALARLDLKLREI